MNRIFSIFTLLSSPFIFSQQLLPIQQDTTILHHEIIVSGDVEYSGTALQRDFANHLIFGGVIGNDLKQQAFDRQRSMNRIGAVLEGEIEYRNYNVNLFGSPKWGFLVKGGYYMIGSGGYSKDLFGLAFNGNDSYLGTTANLSGSGMRLTGFQKIGFGMIHKKSKSSLTLNYVNVTNYYRGGINTGELKQDIDAENADLTLNGNIDYTNKSTFSNGMGVALDFDYRFKIVWLKEKTAFFQIQVRNFGFAYMHQGLKSYSADSIYHYSGFDFEQLKNAGNTFSGDFSLLDSLNIRSGISKKVIALPFYVQFGKIVSENYQGKLQSFFGIRIYPMPTYSPMFYLGGNYRPIENLDLGLSANYGGFTGFRAGFYASVKIKNFNVGIGTENIYGLVAKKALGESFNLRLRCRF